MRRFLVGALLIIPFYVIASDNDGASNDDWEDDWNETEETDQANSFPITGFAQYFYSQRTVDNELIEEDQMANEARLRLETSGYLGNIFLSYKGDIYFDAVSDQFSARNREAFANFSPTSSIDIRAGRQILTWGTGDLLFLNDLFPKNWIAFFTGEDQQYLKAPSDAIKASWFGQALNIDIVWTPIFDQDIYIDGERISFYSPLSQSIIAADSTAQAIKPQHSLDNGEFASRLNTTSDGVEYAAYLYRGFFKTPKGYDPRNGDLYFPRLNVYGASVRRSIAAGIGNIEYSYQDSIEDKDGFNPFIPNSESRILFGYEQEIIKRLTGSIQYYVEHLHNWSHIEDAASGTPTPERNRQVITIRATYLSLQDRLRTSIFLFISPSDNDLYFLPSITYRASDSFEINTGLNYFEGADIYTMFGQFEDNSNAYVRIKYLF